MVQWSPFVMSFKKKYPWIQLAGHAGNGVCSPREAPGGGGRVLRERAALEQALAEGVILTRPCKCPWTADLDTLSPRIHPPSPIPSLILPLFVS